MKKSIVFTDCDLDGIGSYLVFKWFTGTDAEHKICSQSNFRKTFSGHFAKRSVEDYNKIYIFDLDVSQENLDLVDHENVVIIDHHDTHIKNQDKYKNAKTILIDTTSCCKLIYSIYKKRPNNKIELTDSQKLLVLMVNDYDCYELKVKDSYNLNVVLWNYVGNRAEQFVRDFNTGFKGFNQSHLNMIHLNRKKVDRILNDLQIFAGEIPICGNQYNLYATMADSAINEVAHHVIDNYKCDICMVLNIQTSRISFRKNKETAAAVDLGNLASVIADGGGHAYSAGGKINERVMTLTKMLTQVK